MTKRGGEHLGLVAVVLVDLHDLVDQLHAVGRDIIKTAHERADVRGACFSSNECLRGREAQRTVGADALFGKALDGFDAVEDERYLDDHVVVDLGKGSALAHDALIVGRGYLGRDIPIYELADLVDVLVEVYRSEE